MLGGAVLDNSDHPDSVPNPVSNDVRRDPAVHDRPAVDAAAPRRGNACIGCGPAQRLRPRTPPPQPISNSRRSRLGIPFSVRIASSGHVALSTPCYFRSFELRQREGHECSQAVVNQKANSLCINTNSLRARSCCATRCKRFPMRSRPCTGVPSCCEAAPSVLASL